MLVATKESFARALENLVRKFDADRETYLSPGYGEAQARSHFITPLFKALGWDVENEAAVPFHLCDVWEEKGETAGRPDYTFRINGETKFFVEAKAPSVSLGTAAAVLQTKAYAWNSRDVLFAGLTHFEEIRFFDASLEPDERNPLNGEAFHLQHTEYLGKIDLLWELSRERVGAGSLDQFLKRDRKSIRYRIPVDKKFLDELTEWRQELASSIHRGNPEIDTKALNDVVQRLLDRIIFIRIAEDRRVIEPRQLQDIVELWEERGGKRPIMEDLVGLFQEINNDFNGEIFKPHPCEQLKVESGLLARIVRRLYPPKSPYRFDVIGVELLGSIYERYLGYTLNVTAKQVRLVPKPEVRKAGGVYYTPQYVVDYIVRNTLGEFLKNKTPKEVEQLRVLDPACGSGSFLLGAFQFLIEWHLNYYREHPKEAVVHPFFPQTAKDADGNLRLSFHSKTQIMRHNLYGVDIDPQAVEVTMMSLYLKALEGEGELLGPKHEKLPELKYNIRVGNSLIGPDVEDEEPLTSEERDRVKPFDWRSREEGVGDILARNGFDVIIGNPPWGYDFQDLDLAYLQKTYSPVIVRMTDSFMFFVSKATELAAPNGWIGMIVPDVLLYQVDNEKLRDLLLNRFSLSKVANLGDQVFAHVTRPSCIFTVYQGGRGEAPVRVYDLSGLKPEEKTTSLQETNITRFESQINQGAIKLLPGKIIPVRQVADYSVWFKVKNRLDCKELVGLVDTDGIQRGVSPDLKDAFIVSAADAKRMKLEKAWLRRVLLGGDIKSFCVNYQNRLVIYVTRNDDPKRFKNIRRFIESHKNDITCREVKEGKHSLYVLHRARDPKIFLKKPKLIGVITEDEPIIARDDEQIFTTDGAYVFGLKDDIEPNYVLAILNSRLMKFLYRLVATEENRVLAQVKPAVLGTLPIRVLDGAVARDRRAHDEIIRLVETLTALCRKNYDNPDPIHQRAVNEALAALDDLIFDIYEISGKDRQIIDEAVPAV